MIWFEFFMLNDYIYALVLVRISKGVLEPSDGPVLGLVIQGWSVQ